MHVYCWTSTKHTHFRVFVCYGNFSNVSLLLFAHDICKNMNQILLRKTSLRSATHARSSPRLLYIGVAYFISNDLVSWCSFQQSEIIGLYLIGFYIFMTDDCITETVLQILCKMASKTAAKTEEQLLCITSTNFRQTSLLSDSNCNQLVLKCQKTTNQIIRNRISVM